MNYWVISDTHFNHIKLEEWGKRIGDWQEKIWEGLDKIPAEDILIHLGDICIGNDKEIHERLAKYPFRKVLVKGNHDGKSTHWYQENGWDFVCDSVEIIYRGYYLLFSHRPMPQFGHITQNIHGHTHGDMHRSEEYLSFYEKKYHIDICPEIKGFKPIKLEEIVNSIKKISL